MTFDEQVAATEQAADMMGPLLVDFQRRTGLPWPELLLGAHAEVVAQLVRAIGCEMALACIDTTRTQVELLSESPFPPLIDVKPMGRA